MHSSNLTDVTVELASSADCNKHTPESPALFSKIMRMNVNIRIWWNTLKSSEVRDEFTASADDNEDIPVYPILLPVF